MDQDPGRVRQAPVCSSGKDGERQPLGGKHGRFGQPVELRRAILCTDSRFSWMTLAMLLSPVCKQQRLIVADAKPACSASGTPLVSSAAKVSIMTFASGRGFRCGLPMASSNRPRATSSRGMPASRPV